MEFNLMAWVSTRLYSLSSAKDVMAAAEALAVEASAEAGRKVTAAEIIAAFRAYAGTVAQGTQLAHQVRSVQSSLAMAGRTGLRGLLLGGGGTAGSLLPALLLLIALGAGVYVARNLAGRLSTDRPIAAGTLGDPNRTQNPPTALPIPTSSATRADQVPGAGQVWRLKAGYPKPNKEMAGYIAQGTIDAQPGILRVKDGDGSASWVFTELPEKLVVGETYTLKLDSSSERLKDPKSQHNGYAAVLQIAGNWIHPGEEHSTKYIKAVITPHDATVRNAATSGAVMFRFEPTRAEFSVVVRVVGYAGSYVYEYERQP